MTRPRRDAIYRRCAGADDGFSWRSAGRICAPIVARLFKSCAARKIAFGPRQGGLECHVIVMPAGNSCGDRQHLGAIRRFGITELALLVQRQRRQQEFGLRRIGNRNQHHRDLARGICSL